MPEGKQRCAEQSEQKYSFFPILPGLDGDQQTTKKGFFQQGRKEEQGEDGDAGCLCIQELKGEEIAKGSDRQSNKGKESQ